MGIFTRLFERREAPGGDFNVVYEVLEKARESGSLAVTADSALRLVAVYACVRILAETVASLPLIFYERQEQGKRRAQDFYLYRLLHDRPNPKMTSMEFRETLQGHLALRGNAYAQIIYDERGRVAELWPLRPDHVQQTKIVEGRRWYQYLLPDGKLDWYSEDEIWHLRGFGGDGYDGYSPIGLARRAVSLGMSAEQFGAKFFENDARPGIVLEHPKSLGEEAYQRLRDSWEERHKGAQKSHRPAILEEGMTLHEIGIPPEDAQFLETRKFQVQEIARLFRVPPHMLADLERATFSNIEHQGIEFVVHTIRPWLVRWEQSIDQNLMLPNERERYYAEHLVDGLLRGDTASRYQAYAVARQNGWMSANDIRVLENMNPIQGGDVYLVPLNMVPADEVGSRQLSANSLQRSVVSQQLSANSLEPRAEERGKAAATERHRLMRSYKRLFKDTAARVIRKEGDDVRAASKKMLTKGDVTQFKVWMSQYYEDLKDFTGRRFLPLTSSYGEIVGDQAAKEINFEGSYQERVDRFVRAYTTSLAERHSGRSVARLTKRLDEATQDDDLDAIIGAELDHWIDVRTNEIADEESVRLNNAVARTLYEIGGWLTLRSIAFGENCPYCDNLDGKVIGIQENFLDPGDFQPEGADGPLKIEMPMQHAPFHAGCDCMVIAG